MALSNDLSSIKGIHVSPGIYAQETVLEYAVKSLGITTLGAVGETVKGPAFQPIQIADWNEFKSVFGGTDPSKFKGSQYPKYELPYIAKHYLTESKQLEVVRVLGIGGYNAGPAWVVTAQKGNDDSKKYPVAIIRSRGYYEKYPSGSNDSCDCVNSQYDKLTYYVGESSDATTDCTVRKWDMDALKITGYTDLNGTADCNNSGGTPSGTEAGYTVSAGNYGKFTLSGYTDGNTANKFTYPVSLNPGDKDYILKVLGTTPDNGDAPIYVEALYDVVYQNLVDKGEVNKISEPLEAYEPKNDNEVVILEPVADIASIKEADLTRANLYKRYLVKDANTYHYSYEVVNGETVSADTTASVGDILEVVTEDGNTRSYKYKKALSGVSDTQGVENIADGLNYIMVDNKVEAVTVDMNNYKSSYRYASTPWVVSNLLGDYNNMKVEPMFRFHTISDGDASNFEVKVSIENIRTDEGVFDVCVHPFNDTDEKPVFLERFVKCSMIPGKSNYIAFKIGSSDGSYESKSKYITVEVNESAIARNASPAGFLGYPLMQFRGVSFAEGNGHSGMTDLPVSYNVTYDPDVKSKKQYFGMSSNAGIDIDMLKFNGVTAYYETQDFMSPGFHLDSRLQKYEIDNTGIAKIGEGENKWLFSYVKMSNVTPQLPNIPVIDKEEKMVNTIYENVNARKFVLYFAGGFDGWDIYRDERTNTDDFKLSKYRGSINNKSGKGYNFDKIVNPEVLGLDGNGITSDYYAYLSAARQFANPEAVDCNVFVTPGIDLINNKELSEEIIDMIENERADSIYVATLPDKPSGAGDNPEEMYDADEVVGLLEATDIDSNYTCTYYPWVKYYDEDNSQYIMLPATKDVVKNMASTDNNQYPWFAPAGMNRGDVNCVRAHIATKIGEEDTLYEGRVNPIKTFAQDGVKIWGQKTLQTAENQLNRIATRRLLLRMRKLIAIACRQLVFEPNDPTAKQQFLSIVTPIMDNIRSNRGITDYRIEVLDSVESRERYELPARIFFKTPGQIEYVILDFTLMPEGLSFDAI